jgi:hypothetical protein
MTDECRAGGEIRTGRGNGGNQRKAASMPLCSQHMAWSRTELEPPPWKDGN